MGFWIGVLIGAAIMSVVMSICLVAIAVRGNAAVTRSYQDYVAMTNKLIELRETANNIAIDRNSILQNSGFLS